MTGAVPPLKLVDPRAKAWPAYSAAIDDFDSRILHIADANAALSPFAQLRIVEATVPISTGPGFHVTGASGCGIGLVKNADAFTIKLSNGAIVTAN